MTTPTEADVRRRIAELKNRKAELIKEGRKLNNNAFWEGRDLAPDEQRRFNAIMSEVDTINAEIRKGEDLIIASRPSGRNEAWRRRTFSRGFREKRL